LEEPEQPEQLVAQVPPGERILLLPHCLRRSAVCVAKPSAQGLQCASCTPECPINQLRHKALDLGYREVCVASGGHMALKHVADSKPAAVVAVACAKELAEGIEGVKALMAGDAPPLPIAIIPLTKDGCVDTEVDIEQAIKVVALGCETRTLPAQADSGCRAAGPIVSHPARPRPPRCPFGQHEESLNP
jgi:hypothetical protein